MSYRLLQGIFSLTMLLCGLALFLHTYDEQYLPMGGATGSIFYPRLLFIFWVVTSLGMLWDAVRNAPAGFKPVEWLRVASAVLLTGAFIFLFDRTGFVIASSVFFMGFSLLLGARSYVRLGLLAVIYSFGIDFIFTRLLQISLPAWGG